MSAPEQEKVLGHCCFVRGTLRGLHGLPDSAMCSTVVCGLQIVVYNLVLKVYDLGSAANHITATVDSH